HVGSPGSQCNHSKQQRVLDHVLRLLIAKEFRQISHCLSSPVCRIAGAPRPGVNTCGCSTITIPADGWLSLDQARARAAAADCAAMRSKRPRIRNAERDILLR